MSPNKISENSITNLHPSKFQKEGREMNRKKHIGKLPSLEEVVKYDNSNDDLMPQNDDHKIQESESKQYSESPDINLESLSEIESTKARPLVEPTVKKKKKKSHKHKKSAKALKVGAVSDDSQSGKMPEGERRFESKRKIKSFVEAPTKTIEDKALLETEKSLEIIANSTNSRDLKNAMASDNEVKFLEKRKSSKPLIHEVEKDSNKSHDNIKATDDDVKFSEKKKSSKPLIYEVDKEANKSHDHIKASDDEVKLLEKRKSSKPLMHEVEKDLNKSHDNIKAPNDDVKLLDKRKSSKPLIHEVEKDLNKSHDNMKTADDIVKLLEKRKSLMNPSIHEVEKDANKSNDNLKASEDKVKPLEKEKSSKPLIYEPERDSNKSSDNKKASEDKKILEDMQDSNEQTNTSNNSSDIKKDVALHYKNLLTKVKTYSRSPERKYHPKATKEIPEEKKTFSALETLNEDEEEDSNHMIDDIAENELAFVKRASRRKKRKSSRARRRASDVSIHYEIVSEEDDMNFIRPKSILKTSSKGKRDEKRTIEFLPDVKFSESPETKFIASQEEVRTLQPEIVTKMEPSPFDMARPKERKRKSKKKKSSGFNQPVARKSKKILNMQKPTDKERSIELKNKVSDSELADIEYESDSANKSDGASQKSKVTFSSDDSKLKETNMKTKYVDEEPEVEIRFIRLGTLKNKDIMLNDLLDERNSSSESSFENRSESPMHHGSSKESLPERNNLSKHASRKRETYKEDAYEKAFTETQGILNSQPDNTPSDDEPSEMPPGIERSNKLLESSESEISLEKNRKSPGMLVEDSKTVRYKDGTLRLDSKLEDDRLSKVTIKGLPKSQLSDTSSKESVGDRLEDRKRIKIQTKTELESIKDSSLLKRPSISSLDILETTGGKVARKLSKEKQKEQSEMTMDKPLQENIYTLTNRLNLTKKEGLQYPDSDDEVSFDSKSNDSLDRKVVTLEFLDEGSWSGGEQISAFDSNMMISRTSSSTTTPTISMRFTETTLMEHLVAALSVQTDEGSPKEFSKLIPTETIVNFNNPRTNLQFTWTTENITFVEPLGMGHFGGTYLIKNSMDRTTAVLKAIEKNYLKTQREIANQKKIWKMASKHYYVITLEAYFETSKCYCFIQYQALKGSLHKLLESGPLKEKAVVQLIAQISLALEFLHDNGITHRNVSPFSILLSKKGKARLADFETATYDLTTIGVVGRLKYQAPEVLRGNPSDWLCDWWSLGAVTYEALFGKTPIDIFLELDNPDDASDDAISNGIIYGDIVSIAMPGVTDNAKLFLSDLLQKNPLDRLGSIEEADFKKHPFFKSVTWSSLEKQSTLSRLTHLFSK